MFFNLEWPIVLYSSLHEYSCKNPAIKHEFEYFNLNFCTTKNIANKGGSLRAECVQPGRLALRRYGGDNCESQDLISLEYLNFEENYVFF